MYEINAIIKSKYGLHARPSSKITQANIDNFPNTRIILKDIVSGNEADAKSVTSLLCLALGCGETVMICTTGESEKEAAEAIALIIETYEV